MAKIGLSLYHLVIFWIPDLACNKDYVIIERGSALGSDCESKPGGNGVVIPTETVGKYLVLELKIRCQMTVFLTQKDQNNESLLTDLFRFFILLFQPFYSVVYIRDQYIYKRL